MPEQDTGYISKQHPQRGAADYGDKRIVFRCQHDSCDLGLVTDFSQNNAISVMKNTP
jgi:hypothetical protein